MNSAINTAVNTNTVVLSASLADSSGGQNLADAKSGKRNSGRRKKVKQTSQALAVFALFLLMAIALTSVASAIYVVTQRIHIDRVLSDSMQPAFGRGDILLVKPVAKNQVKRGDVVVLPIQGEPGSRFAHRIISAQKTNGRIEIQTKGDANSVMDPWTLVITSPEVPKVVSSLPASFLPFITLNRYVYIGAFVILCLLFIWLLTPSRVSPENPG
ncbi:MAG: signal peptidase I [Actinomycetales bacterium]|nr:signal peptidase I [Actinomycetales bacterium]